MMLKRAVSIALSVAILFVLLVVMCGRRDSPKSPAPSSDTLRSSNTREPSSASSPIPYQVISREEYLDAKVTYAIRVKLVDGRLPNEQELGAISNGLREKERRFENMFVEFHLPDMEVKSSAFAVAHHTPEPQKVIVFVDRLPKKHQEMLSKREGAGTPKGPTQCDRIDGMMKVWGSFSEEKGTFRLLEDGNIPHVQVSPTFVRGDLDRVKRETVKRALVETVLRTFIHTKYEGVRVTALPALISINPRKMSYETGEEVTIAVSRKDALAIMKAEAKIEGFGDLCGTYLDTTYMPDFPTELFYRCSFNDQGPPTLNRIYQEFAKSSGSPTVSSPAPELKTPASLSEMTVTPTQPKTAIAPKPPARLREWTDSTGTFKVEAEFVSMAIGKVRLRKATGEEITVEMEKLSEEDQDWIRTRKRGRESLFP